jgi:hypothetical protein
MIENLNEPRAFLLLSQFVGPIGCEAALNFLRG